MSAVTARTVLVSLDSKALRKRAYCLRMREISSKSVRKMFCKLSIGSSSNELHARNKPRSVCMDTHMVSTFVSKLNGQELHHWLHRWLHVGFVVLL